MAGDQDDPGLGGRRPQAGQGVEGVGAGHAAVEQHDVGLLPLRRDHGGGAVARLGHDLESACRRQRQADQQPVVRVVVDDQDTLGTHCSTR